MINSYKDLNVWKKSLGLVKEIYLLSKRLPKDEMFGLKSQMRRSAVSIPSNIAEGWMRQHTNEYVQFIYHALGFCGELYTQLTISEGLNYIQHNEIVILYDRLDYVGRMLRKLVGSLRR